MLIVCPSCTTSYMIEPASVGPAGRNVRCARCRETWFINPPQVDEPVDAFVHGVIADAEAEVSRPPDRPREPEPDVYTLENPTNRSGTTRRKPLRCTSPTLRRSCRRSTTCRSPSLPRSRRRTSKALPRGAGCR